VAILLTARTRSRVRLLAVPALGVLVLLTAGFGLTDGAIALAIGAGGVALWATVLLVNSALSIHHRTGTFAAFRGAGFVGMGALTTGLTVLLPAVGGSGVLAIIGLALACAFFVLGVSLLPGAASSPAIRLRRLFDGLGLGISVAFAAYVVQSVSLDDPAVLALLLITSTAVAMTAVIALRDRSQRTAALRCAAGGILVMIFLSAVVNHLAVSPLYRPLPAIGIALVAGLTLVVDGGVRRGAVSPAATREPEQYLSAYPLLAVPAAVGVVAATYQLIVNHKFGATATALGLSIVGILILRELLVVSDIRRYAGQLKTKEAHFRSLVAGATDLTLVLDDTLRIQWQSPAAARLFGLSDAEVVGRTFRELIHPDDVGEAQAMIESVLAGEHAEGPPALVNARLRDGHDIWRDTESTISDQRKVPEVAALVVHVRDVGERRHLERTLHRLSYSDQLTGLANRRALMRDLLAHRRRPGRPGTLLVIDLHGLSEINAERGRETGDAVLIEMGRRIRALLSDDDVPARLGGDEFAVLTGDGAVLAYALATRIVTVLKEPYQLPGTVVEVHTSVGLAELSGGADSDEVLRHADLARSRAFQLGRDRVEWYDTDVEIQLYRRMDLERELLGAVDRAELDLVFQPIVGLRDKQPAGVEALLRWRHPTLGTIMPNELLPVARALGIAAELDEWVLDAACRHLVGWTAGGTEFWLSVNVAPRELLAPGFAERTAATLRRCGLPPERLVVEVAEEWIAADVPAIVASLAGLRKLGVRAALDDFGAGQASLSHLRRLPVDMLKLDRALAGTPAEHPVGQAVIEVVVSLGKRLGLEIVAKGLETEEQVERAQRAGCHYGQGFALARPAPAERMEAYLETHRG
jgi:diguanylate cyclase (GGDEF)-like protein/PAS domain S-box-containing protein